MRPLALAAVTLPLLGVWCSALSGCGTGSAGSGTITALPRPTSAATGSATGRTSVVPTPAGHAEVRSDESATPLPIDPNIKLGVLPNGMHYWIRAHQTPPGKIGMWLHVGSGSVNEADDQRGLAHFLEHLGFNGTENFPPGTLVKYFESIGLRFGQHQNAFTGFDQTTYVISLPNTRDETLRRGLLCLADFAFRMSLLQKEIDKERDVILEEMRARKGAHQRILDKLLPLLLPGSRVAQRLPIGKEEVLKSAGRERFKAYYGKWYRPDNATLLVVGEKDAAAVEKLVAEAFGPWPEVANSAPNEDPGIKPYTDTRAAVVTDPELTQTEVSVVSVRPLEKMETVGEFRQRQVDRLGIWIVNRRLTEMIQKGTAPFQRAALSKSPFLNVCTYLDAEASGEPDKWAPMMKALLVELKRVQQHGFLAQELADAKKAALAAVEQAARTEPTRDARTLLHAMNSAVSQKRKPMSQVQRLALVRRLLPGLSLQEVAATFQRNFSPDSRLLLLTMPDKEGLAAPSRQEVLELAREAEATPVEALAQRVRPQRLLERDPVPGTVASQVEDPDLKILSVRFANGVRVHLRHMDFKKDQVIATVTLAGGTIQETPANRGVTAVAALVLSQPAARTLDSTDIRDLMTGKNVSVRGGHGQDAITIRVIGTPDDLEAGLQLVHLLLSAPRIEASALALWKKRQSQLIERRKTSVESQLEEQVSALMSGSDYRFQFLTEAQVQALQLADGQAWLERILRSGPIEASIVGDISRDRALALARTYLASLPARPIHDAELDRLRTLRIQVGPLEKTIEVETITPRAVVRLAWRGAEWTEVKFRRTLSIAAQILNGRLREEIREKRGLTYSIHCYNYSAQDYHGASLFQVHFTADPEKAAQAAALARELVETFAREGPTDDEIATARKQFENIIGTAQKTPRYWASVLADLHYHGTKLADVKEVLEKYTTYTREDITASLQQCITEERRILVIAKPKQKAGNEPESPGERRAKP